MRSYIYNKNSVIGSQAEHCGMRTYFFSADTQEDMNGWIRAMNQAALMQQSHTIKRLVSHYRVAFTSPIGWASSSNNILPPIKYSSLCGLDVSGVDIIKITWSLLYSYVRSMLAHHVFRFLCSNSSGALQYVLSLFKAPALILVS